MQTNANRATLKRSFMRFSRTISVNDMRPEESTRKHRAERFERKNKTGGKLSRFPVNGRSFVGPGWELC